jgi:hypothetical protein
MLLTLLSDVRLLGFAILAILWVANFLPRQLATTPTETVKTHTDFTFIRRVSVIFGLLVILVGVFNYLINPLGIFPPKVLPPIGLTSRFDKLALWTAYNLPPDVVIVGSSRSFTMSPSYIQQMRGQTAFNASVVGGTPRDFYGFLHYAIQHQMAPKSLIVGLGIEQLDDSIDINAVEPSDPLKPYADETQPSWTKSLQQTLGLFSIEETEASLKSILSRVSAPPARNYRFENDGQGYFQQAGNAEYFVERFLNSPNIEINPNAVETRQFGFIRKIIELCDNQHIALTIYLPPFYPSVRDYFETQTSFLQSKALVLEQLNSLRTQHPFVVIDYSADSRFTAAMFYDELHPTEQASQIMTDEILKDHS